ncbi:MAG: putative ABC transporter permease [Bacilli bacterium]|nr:putative ABC transporter permease [Bacilli bacterium]
MYLLMYLFLIFFIYSIIGYIIEVTSCIIITKKFTMSRGYLLGPYIPVFGFGALLMVTLLSKYKNDVIVLFILSGFLCSAVEYFVSLLMELIFKLRWWDYSKDKFNINGRICLRNGFLFGIGGVIIVKYFHPLLDSFLLSLGHNTIIIVGWIFAGIIIIDTIISTFTISKLKIDTKKYLNQDATDVIKEQVADTLSKYRVFYKRLFRAYPHIKLNANIMKFREFMDEQMSKTMRLVKIKDKDK